MSEQSLKHKTTVGVFWSFIERFSVQLIQLVLGIVLARLLLPSDFGLIGMLTVFIAVSGLFIDSGFPNALIQKKNRTEKDFSTVFYFNILISLLCYILLYISAPFISAFYHTPELISIIRILFLNLIINSFATVQNVKLRIALNFKKKAVINLTSIIISGGIGILMAYAGSGVWALVAQTLSNSLITLILLQILVKWKPLLVFSKSSFNQLFNFGSKLLGAAFIDAVMDNLYSILIGRYFSSAQVGYYNRGLQMPTVVSGTVSSTLESVVYPVMTSVQDDRKLLLSIYRRLIRVVSFLIIPAMIGLVIISEPFVRYFLTEKWMPAVILMQWMCFARIFSPINLLNISLLNAVGRSDLFLKINLSKLPIAIITLIITIPMGVKAVVIGHFINSIIGFFVNAYMPGKLFGYGAMAQMKDMLRSFFCSGPMAIVLFLLSNMIHQDLIKIIACIIVGGGIYYFLALFFKMDEIGELNIILKKIWRKVK
ncbi:MAG: lipopolysaccharide biosynthesis protein [Candidatus Symbiothrix sp.]|jgi:O-antigen/teichoic acid export membrane protein|nr:lipopolysaccharide biosynthesis protein [Candidatus Symbiothrix sp.]